MARDGRPAPLHVLGPADAHRLRRLPGLHARRAAEDHRGGRRASQSTSTAPAQLTPERATRIQEPLGATSSWRSTSARRREPAAPYIEESLARTTRWAAALQADRLGRTGGRARALRDRPGRAARRPAGATPRRLRAGPARLRARRLLRGRGAGGDVRRAWMPPRRCCRRTKPRYLMGVGTPEDLRPCVRFGRGHVRLRPAHPVARNGLLFTAGARSIKNGAYAKDARPGWTRSAAATPAATSPAPTSGTSSWRRRSWPCG